MSEDKKRELLNKIKSDIKYLKSKLNNVESKLIAENRIIDNLEQKTEKLNNELKDLTGNNERLEILSEVMNVAFEGKNIPKILLKKRNP